MTTATLNPVVDQRVTRRDGKKYANSTIGFAWLRLLAALTVVLDHSAVLVNPERPNLFNWNIGIGEIGLLAFFAMSGFQVRDSWERDPSWWRFTARRLLRVVPPLAVMVVLTALVVGPLVTSLSAGEYFSQGSTWAYLGGAGVFWIQYTITGVFDANPYGWSINPSLWTLPMEVLGYALVLLVGLVIALGVSRIALWVVLGGLMVQQAVFLWTTGPEGGPWMGTVALMPLVAFMVPFIMGVTLRAYRDRIPLRPRYAAVLFGAWLVFHLLTAPATAKELIALDSYLLAAATAYGVITLAHNWPKLLESSGRWVYGSYGLYIWAAVVQQLLIFAGVRNMWLLVALAVPGAYLVGLLSWHLVEAPTQKWRTHLRAPQRKTPEAGLSTISLAEQSSLVHHEKETVRA